MNNWLFYFVNGVFGFALGYIISPKAESFTKERIKNLIDFLNLDVKADRRDFYTNRYLTLAGFSMTSLALYLSWSKQSNTIQIDLVKYLFLAVLIFLIASQITIESEHFWQIWGAELLHYIGILNVIYALGKFVNETFPTTNLSFIVGVALLLTSTFVIKLLKDFRENINNYNEIMAEKK